MSGLQSRYKTLADLRSELRVRLGFIAQGPAAANNTPVLDSFLQEAHEYVYAKLRPSPVRKKAIIKLLPGEILYDYHNDDEDEDIDPGLVKSVWVKISDTIREPMSQGINERDRALATFRAWPEKYDTLNGQMEIFPIPAREYDMVVEYLAPAGRFEQDQDRTSVPHRLVFLYALANAKAHYRHPDAQGAATTFTNMLDIEMGKQHENKRYVKETSAPVDTAQVVQTSTGYVLRSRG